MMRVDKEKNKLWAKRMHTSLKCYKENLVTLFAIEKKLANFEKNQSQVESSKLNSLDQNVNLEEDDQLADLTEKNIDTSQSTTKLLLDERSMDIVDKLKS